MLKLAWPVRGQVAKFYANLFDNQLSANEVLHQLNISHGFDRDYFEPDFISPGDESLEQLTDQFVTNCTNVIGQNLTNSMLNTDSNVFGSLTTNQTLDWSTNCTTNDTLPEGNEFILPWWQQIAWLSIFGLMVMVATGGNLIVIWIVLSNKKMRTVTNFFIVNLSIADTMVSTLNVVFNFIYMLNGDWPFGATYCKVSNFIAILSVAASVLTLVAIAIDR